MFWWVQGWGGKPETTLAESETKERNPEKAAQNNRFCHFYLHEESFTGLTRQTSAAKYQTEYLSETVGKLQSFNCLVKLWK